MKASGPAWVDAGLLAVVVVWAVNFSVVKAVLADLPPLAFNTLRLVGASLLLLAIAWFVPGKPVAPDDRWRLVLLALVGHTAYQFLFIFGIHRTTATNSAILLGTTPLFVAVLARLFGIERPARRTWLGILVSMLGVYLVLRRSGPIGGDLLGDLLILAATVCWATYTVLGKPLLDRYGLVRTNAYTIAIGSLFFLPAGIPSLAAVSLTDVPTSAWWGTLYSLVFALVVAYCLWYYAVSRIGPSRTSVFSNLVPVAAMAIAWLTLGERVTVDQILGTLVILAGIHLVRTDTGGRSPRILTTPPRASSMGTSAPRPT